MKAKCEVLPKAMESHKVVTEARLAGIKEAMKEKMVKNVDVEDTGKVKVEMTPYLRVRGS